MVLATHEDQVVVSPSRNDQHVGPNIQYQPPAGGGGAPSTGFGGKLKISDLPIFQLLKAFKLQ